MWSRVPTCAMMGCYREDHPQSWASIGSKPLNI
jgi:hypothetical protein